MKENVINVPSIEVMTARPEKMSYQTYRQKRTHLNKMLKDRLKGIVCYVASEMIPHPNIEGSFLTKKFPPFVGTAPSVRIKK